MSNRWVQPDRLGDGNRPAPCAGHCEDAAHWARQYRRYSMAFDALAQETDPDVAAELLEWATKQTGTGVQW